MKITYIKIFVMSVVNIIVFSNIFSKQFKKKVITKEIESSDMLFLLFFSLLTLYSVCALYINRNSSLSIVLYVMYIIFCLLNIYTILYKFAKRKK